MMYSYSSGSNGQSALDFLPSLRSSHVLITFRTWLTSLDLVGLPYWWISSHVAILSSLKYEMAFCGRGECFVLILLVYPRV
jgi:hypothetical protein